MVSTPKNRQQNKRLPSQLGESHAEITIVQNNHIAQNENRNSTIGEDIILNNTNNRSQFSGSQVDVHTLEKDFAYKV